MGEYFDLGKQLGDFLRGLLEIGARPSEVPKGVMDWGPRIDWSRLKDLYAPQVIEPYTATPAGIDNLALSSADTFMVPGKGEFTVNFAGYFRVARAEPTTKEWATCEVYVNMIDMRLTADSPELGPIRVSLNADAISWGQVFPAGSPTGVAKCRISTAAVFDMPRLGVTMFNKEPILLMNDGISSIPPVEDPNGAAHIYNLPLYDRARPNGKPVAYLKSLKYTVGNYITEAEARALRVQVPHG